MHILDSRRRNRHGRSNNDIDRIEQPVELLFDQRARALCTDIVDRKQHSAGLEPSTDIGAVEVRVLLQVELVVRVRFWRCDVKPASAVNRNARHLDTNDFRSQSLKLAYCSANRL